MVAIFELCFCCKVYAVACVWKPQDSLVGSGLSYELRSLGLPANAFPRAEPSLLLQYLLF